MSKGLARVMDALKAAKCAALAMEMPAETRTAAQAAAAATCDIDQIAKSIIFAGADSGALWRASPQAARILMWCARKPALPLAAGSPLSGIWPRCSETLILAVNGIRGDYVGRCENWPCL